MPIPRNARAKNANTHKRTAYRIGLKKATELDDLCEKHRVGTLEFRSCKLATEDGDVTFINHDTIKGNMKSGIMIVKAEAIIPAPDSVYDIVEIARNKKEKDDKKKEKELKEAQEELEKIKASEDRLKENIEQETTNKEPNEKPANEQILDKLLNKEGIPTEEEKTNDLLNELDDEIDVEISSDTTTVEKSSNQTVAINEIPSEQNDQIDQTDNSDTANDVNNIIEVSDSTTKSKTQRKKEKMLNEKREKALKQLQEQLAQKEKEKEGNKYYRNFMRDLKSKFALVEQPEFRYFEAKVESADMVIDHARVYKISMPDNVKESYLLVIGDLTMKSGLIRQIDPTYRGDKVVKEQSDFLERIMAKENTKINKLSPDTIVDEMEILGLSEEESDTQNEIDNNIDDTENKTNNSESDDDIPPLEKVSQCQNNAYC